MPEDRMLAIGCPAVFIVPHASQEAGAAGRRDEVRAEQPHLRRRAGRVEHHLKEVAALPLCQVGKAHGDPVLHGVFAHAPQQCGVYLRHIMQRGVGHGHVDQVPQLLIAVLFQHVGVLVQDRQALPADAPRVRGGEGAPQAHVLQHQIGIAVAVCRGHSPEVVHHAQSAILAPLEGLAILVGAAKEIHLPPLTDRVLAVQSSAGGASFELTPVILVRLHEAAHPVNVDVHHSGCQVLDPAQTGLQLRLGVAQLPEALPDRRQRGLVAGRGVGAHVLQGRPLAGRQLLHSSHLGLRKDGSPERLLVFQDPNLPQRRHHVAVAGVAEDPALRHHLAAAASLLLRIYEVDQDSVVGHDPQFQDLALFHLCGLLPIWHGVVGPHSRPDLQDRRCLHAPLLPRDPLAAVLEERLQASGVPHEVAELFERDEAIIVHIHHARFLLAPANVGAHIHEFLAVQLPRLIHVEAAERVIDLRHLVVQARLHSLKVAFRVLDVVGNDRFSTAPHPKEQMVRRPLCSHGFQIRMLMHDLRKARDHGGHLSVLPNLAQSLDDVVMAGANTETHIG
mmetsp:Transcript_108386/g.258653  ORF Transcript_108386/g.258653 Transcript_108386/m.258653 type:complete len:562 (-) Transcript_108386:87-1772(-)